VSKADGRSVNSVPGMPNELDRSKWAVNSVEWPSASTMTVGISGILENEEPSML
jgi:hypothetical protein